MYRIHKEKTLSQQEEDILAFWKKMALFQKSLELSKNRPVFTFYDGPPFATGLPHYGHLLAGTIKDIIPRYKTMKGFHVPRRFGWDCHGLPIENEIEKRKELSGAKEIESFGVTAFNEECRSIVLRYTEQWKSTVERMGRWIDIDGAYRTMDTPYMESVWWVFKQLFNQGLVYQGFKVMPFSAKLGTPLSNFEANLNYQEVDDPSIVVKFKLKHEDSYLLAWTTTPWTLVSNLALAVHPDEKYVKLRDKNSGELFVVADKLKEKHFKDETSYEIIESFLGKKLDNLSYEPLFPYFENRDNAFRVLCDTFVTMEDGTGIVHMAPAFGEQDFFVCQKEGIEIVCPVDHNGRFTKEIPEYTDMLIKDADKPIIQRLKSEGKLFWQGTIRHRYPFCWRSNTPLIYKAVKTWFIKVEDIKEKLLAANHEIHWVPEHIKEGRFGRWLAQARDWAVSRNRYWGTPIPIWKSTTSDNVYVVGSVEELEKLTGEKPEDLHRHHIDHITFEKDGETYERIPEVFDCWFESGSMPYAQYHYPFENKAFAEENFPADFVAEGLDQTRGWFYTLNVLSSALFNRPAFKNVIVNGIILAENGAKMSKSLKNYPDPMEVVNKYGADAIRLYLLKSPAVYGDDLRFSEKGVETILRQILLPFHNAYLFFATYANIYAFKPVKLKPQALIDQWILSRLQRLIIEVETALDQYNLHQAVTPFITFIDQLTNWYIRRSRSRFWADEDSEDRRQAFETLRTVLIQTAKVAAPFIPFFSENLYQSLKAEEDPISVHISDFPKYDDKLRDRKLEKQTEYVQKVVSLGHGLRKETKIKVRQPLKKAHIACSDEKVLTLLKEQENLIAEELNVKEIDFHTNEDTFVTLSFVPNFRNLGKKAGKLVPLLQKQILRFGKHEYQVFQEGGDIQLTADNQTFHINKEDVQIKREVKEGWVAASDQNLVVALETHLSPELLLEGLAREIVNKVNILRKEEGLEVTDRIQLTLETTDRVQSCFDVHGDFITHEILAAEVLFEAVPSGEEIDLNGETTKMSISKVTAQMTHSDN
jgi:isoleucyl-tRNA synthetase